MALRIVVLEGDETGQELLEASLRVLEPDVLRIEIEQQRFDLSLEQRRSTGNEVVLEAARAMREAYGVAPAPGRSTLHGAYAEAIERRRRGGLADGGDGRGRG